MRSAFGDAQADYLAAAAAEPRYARFSRTAISTLQSALVALAATGVAPGTRRIVNITLKRNTAGQHGPHRDARRGPALYVDTEQFGFLHTTDERGVIMPAAVSVVDRPNGGLWEPLTDERMGRLPLGRFLAALFAPAAGSDPAFHEALLHNLPAFLAGLHELFFNDSYFVTAVKVFSPKSSSYEFDCSLNDGCWGA